MKINIHLVRDDGYHIEGEDPASILDVQDHEWSFREPIFHKLDASLVDGALLVTGRLWTKGRVRCSRCLQEFSHPLEITEFVSHTPIGTADIVDLTPEIRETILLEIPQKPLCKEDCRGLCPVCGADWNQQTCDCSKRSGEIRWAGLDKLEF